MSWHVNWRKLAGTHADEIKAHEDLLDGKGESKRRFRDVWRLINGEGVRKYTYVSLYLSLEGVGYWLMNGREELGIRVNNTVVGEVCSFFPRGLRLSLILSLSFGM